MPRKSKDAILDEGGLVDNIEIVDRNDNGELQVINGVDISEYKLTKKELEFVLEYMNNGMNGMLAAKTVFSYRQERAKARAASLINSPKVFPVIQLLLKHSINKSLQFSPALLMDNIQTWLQYDVKNYYTNDGTAIPLDEIDENARQLISGIDYTINNRTGVRYISYKLPDKFKALQELSSIVKFVQSLGMNSPDTDTEAEAKRNEIFGKAVDYVPVEETE